MAAGLTAAPTGLARPTGGLLVGNCGRRWDGLWRDCVLFSDVLL